MKLVIIDDHPLVRKGLSSMLAEDKNVNVTFEASNTKEALNIIEREKPEVALVDLKLGNEDGLDIVVKGKCINPETKFIVLTSYMPREEFLRAERIGLDGYVLKDAFTEDILYAVNLVIRGKKYYDPGIIHYKDRTNNSTLNHLTEREKDVLKELGKGLSNDQIAKQLYISENTVKKHISSILAKLNLTHRTQVIIYFNNTMSS